MSIENVHLLWELAAVVCYFSILIFVAITSYKKQVSDTDFIMGNRSMNFWLTALAAHASDMSSWLFLGYPAAIFAMGVHQAWAGIGLIFFMFLNWQLVAPRIRTATEEYNSLTLSSYFENRLADTTGRIRIFTAVMLFVFYTVYISAALVGMGLLLEILFGIPYSLGVLIGILIVIPYVFAGGYLTLAWIDLFQGFFLMCVVLAVPLFILPKVGGWQGIHEAIQMKNLTSSLIPNLAPKTLVDILFITMGWGLGYFGQPHIVTKFMGIKKVADIGKSKMIGIIWMTLALGGATLVAFVSIPFFTTPLKDNSEVFILMVKDSFPPFIIGLILCAVFAATINAMSSMVLVLSSSLTEDFYKRIFRPRASPRELLLISRLGVVFVSLIAFIIAFAKISTIYSITLYAWSGLGAAFGPLVLLSLYSKRINRYGAWAGIVSGGALASVWFYINKFFPIDVPPVIPAFAVSFILIWTVSYITNRKEKSVSIEL